MTAHEKIAALVATRNEIKGDAGRYWHCDPFTLGYLAQLDAEIAILEDDTLFDDDLTFDTDLTPDGQESVAQLDYEMFCNFVEDCEREQDDMEARGGPKFRAIFPNGEIPF